MCGLHLAHETAQWYAFVNTVMNLLVSQRQEISSVADEVFAFSRMLLREVCELVKYPHFKQLLGNNA
jgi:hypothetical protein